MAEVSFQNQDNFIRNVATWKIPGGSYHTAGALRKVSFDGPLPFSLNELMVDLAIDDFDESAGTVERFARMAGEFIERRTGRVVIQGGYELRMDQWWLDTLKVERYPLRAIDAIQYLTAKDTWATVDPADYWELNTNDAFTIQLLEDFDRPDLWQLKNSIRVNFTAGYDSDEESGTGEVEPLDPGLKMMWSMVTSHFYEYRGLFAADKAAEVEESAGSLLGAYRKFW